MSKITLKELAEQTGLSVSAVSLALNNRPGISEENRQRVLQTAQALGYQHQKVKSGGKKPKQIAILYYSRNVVSTNDAVFPQLLKSINDAADETAWSVKLFFKPQGKDLDEDALQDFAGIILMGDDVLIAPEIRNILAMGLPMVLLDHELYNINCDAVIIDNAQAIQQGFFWLWEHGYHRIAYVGFQPEVVHSSFYNEAAREQAYKDCTSIIGAERRICIVDENNQRQSFYNWYEAQEEKPDAYLFSMDYLMQELVPMMEQMKLNVGKDCAVIGVDNLPFCETASPKLSSIDPNTAERGRVAFRRLLELIRHPDTIPQRIRVGTQLVLRESTPERTR